MVSRKCLLEFCRVKLNMEKLDKMEGIILFVCLFLNTPALHSIISLTQIPQSFFPKHIKEVAATPPDYKTKCTDNV